MKVKTKDGKTVDLSPLNGNEMFGLGRKAAKTGWGQEGGALQKNGPIFRIAWHLGAEPKEGMDICFTEQEVVEAIALAEQENSKKREREELDAKMKPTGLHFIFVNPAEPLPEGFNEFDPHIGGYAVCLTEEAIRKEEAVWQPNGHTTFRVDFTLDQGDTRGTLLDQEQDFLRFLFRTARNIGEDGGTGKAPHGYLHFKGQDMWQLLLKGIKAERIWRTWLRNGRKGPCVVKAQ